MVLVRPSKDVLESLSRLRHDPRLMEWLTSCRERARDETVLQQDETLLRQAQGRAQLMDDLIGLIKLEPKT